MKRMRLIAVFLCFALLFLGQTTMAGAQEESLQVVKTCPKNGLDNVPVIMDISVVFNTNIAMVNNSGISVQSENSGHLAVSPEVKGCVLWLNHKEWLPANDKITVTIPAGSVALAGNPNSKLAGDYSFSFNTGDRLAVKDGEGPIFYSIRSYVTELEETKPPLPGNRAPVAKNDTYKTKQNTRLVVSRPGVLKNDSGENRDKLTAVLVTNPSHGSLYLKPDGSFIYTPNAGFTGKDSFSYQATDGKKHSNTAIVTISVSKKGDIDASISDKTTAKAGKLPGTGGSILLEMIIGAAMAATGLAMYCTRRASRK